MKINYKDVVDKITENNNIYLISHINPDGDNLGSLLGMSFALKKLNKNVKIIKTDNIPNEYLFLPMIESFSEVYPSSIELLLVLDCSDLDRLGAHKQIIDKSKFIINIDHHKSNTFFGDINIVNPKSASTGEIVFDIIKVLDVEINADIATCIYTAISSDTGRFMYENVTSYTHNKVAELINTGIDLSTININLYQKKSLASSKLFINSLTNLRLYNKDKIGIASVSQEMLTQYNANMDETEGIVSFIRDIENIEIACLLKEIKKDEIKISLRSKNYVDVSEICAIFNGGGHKRAAGCTIYSDLVIAEERILTEINRFIR